MNLRSLLSLSAEADLHLVNPLWDATGGADRRTVDLARLMARDAAVRLWSEYDVHADYAGLGVERIRPWRHPRQGTIVIVGVYFRVGAWIRWTRAARVVVLYNTCQPDRLAKLLRKIGDRSVELIFTSEALRRATLDDPLLAGFDRRLFARAPVLESFVDPAAFDRSHARREGRRSDVFTVGRLSRDNPRKHHPDEPDLYAALAASGMRVRVMGGASLAERLTPHAGIDLLAAGAEPAADFLGTLDAFYYRTHPDYLEAFGRVVVEAMTCGLPVVAEARGGYARLIEHGVDGFLFERPEEALAILGRLAADPALRERIGRNARRKAKRLQAELPRRTRDLLLGPVRTPAPAFDEARLPQAA